MFKNGVRVYHNGMRVATFLSQDTAFWFASVYGSRVAPTATFEVNDKTGLIGQFKAGKPTPEFAHLDEAN